VQKLPYTTSNDDRLLRKNLKKVAKAAIAQLAAAAFLEGLMRMGAFIGICLREQLLMMEREKKTAS
jgi:hypothetical protein